MSRAINLMNRRALLGSLALATLARPCAALAQPARKVYRIGILGSGTTSDMIGPQPPNPSTSWLLRGLRELGYVYGEHFVTEPRGTEGRPERFPSLAAELVRLPVDVIVSGPGLPALKQATSTIHHRHDYRQRSGVVGICPQPQTSGWQHYGSCDFGSGVRLQRNRNTAGNCS